LLIPLAAWKASKVVKDQSQAFRLTRQLKNLPTILSNLALSPDPENLALIKQWRPTVRSLTISGFCKVRAKTRAAAVTINDILLAAFMLAMRDVDSSMVHQWIYQVKNIRNWPQ
jgi:hypothetical protein